MGKKIFPPGAAVKVVKTALAGLTGVVIDPIKDLDPRGNPHPRTLPGYYWVIVTIYGNSTFTAHLFEDEIEEVPQPGNTP